MAKERISLEKFDLKNFDIEDKLEYYMRINKMTQADLARALDCTPAQISRWYAKRVRMSHAWKLIVKDRLGIE